VPCNLKHKLHTPNKLRAPWRWPTVKAEACRNINKWKREKRLVLNYMFKKYICWSVMLPTITRLNILRLQLVMRGTEAQLLGRGREKKLHFCTSVQTFVPPAPERSISNIKMLESWQSVAWNKEYRIWV
jgi:hypothetical protein